MKKLLFTTFGLMQAVFLMAGPAKHVADQGRQVRPQTSQSSPSAEVVRPKRPWLLVAVRNEYLPQARVPEQPKGKQAAQTENTQKER